MWLDRTEATEHRVWVGPDFELSIHYEGEFSERRKVAVVEPTAAKELPDTLNGIELRAVRGEEEQREVGLLREAPGGMERRVMVLGIVDDDDHASAGSPADAPQMAQERPAGLGIEITRWGKRAQLAVAQSNGSEVADTLSRRCMDADGIPDLRRNPHTTPAAVLLEVNFIQRPKIDAGIERQQQEFFLLPPALPDPLDRLPVAVCAGEIQIAGTAAGTDAHVGSLRTAFSKTTTTTGRPKGEPASRNRRGCAEAPPLLAPSALGSAAKVSPRADRRPSRQNHPARIDAPSSRPIAARRPIVWRPRDNSGHALQATPRAADDRSVPRGCAESRPVACRRRVGSRHFVAGKNPPFLPSVFFG
jgi:hypothetical protein